MLALIVISILVGFAAQSVGERGKAFTSFLRSGSEALPIIAAISTLIDPPATMLNASGDNVAGMMVSRMVEGKNWLKKIA
jgi:Na+/H+-dicarboxylate symporter